jgi:ligand-binding sensor domain-containing protein
LPSNVPLHVLHRSLAHPERVFVGGRNGVRSIRFDAASDRWIDEGAIAGVDHEVRTIAEDSRGELWLGTPTNGIYRLVFAGSSETSRGNATVSRFLSTHGLPPGQQWTRVVRSARSGVIFATQAGLYRFDAKRAQFTPAVEYGARFTDGSFMLGNVAEGADQHLWLAGRTSDGVWVDQELGRALTSADGAVGFQALPYKIADRIGEIEEFYPERDAAGGEVVWIGGTDGIVRVDVSRLLSLAIKVVSPPSFGAP